MSSGICDHCEKTARERVEIVCSKDSVVFRVHVHGTCAAGYKRSLARFGSKVVSVA